MFSFENPAYFWALIGLVILILLFAGLLSWKRKTRKKIGDKKLIDNLTKNFSTRKFRFKYVLLLLALLLGIFAAVNLRKDISKHNSNNPLTSAGKGIDIVLALDISKSMLAQDLKPTRLDQAKLLANKLLDNLENNRVGIVVFAGQAILQMPVTTDVGASKMLLANLSPETIPIQGTEIGEALLVSNLALGNVAEKKHKAIILISDGEDHDTKTSEAIKNLRQAGVVVYSVGIGSDQGSPIYDPAINDFVKDNDGQTVISKLGTKTLEKVAEETNGAFYRIDNAANAANKIAVAIDQMEKKQLQRPLMGARQYLSSFPYLIGLMLCLLLLDIFINERKRKI